MEGLIVLALIVGALVKFVIWLTSNPADTKAEPRPIGTSDLYLRGSSLIALGLMIRTASSIGSKRWRLKGASLVNSADQNLYWDKRNLSLDSMEAGC
ncbi:hypothetical protein [Azospirillum aestuarii]|uniref:hypothetical protein n=1 Tax=Azospirillum aestuarii TaxID=2802052 RepID=UPI004054C009